MGLIKVNLEQTILQVPIEEIIPNRFQPRLQFEDKGLEELADSIKQHGIIQPLVLRRVEDKYEIIAGERRYKAAQLAGLTQVPAVIANIDDNKSAEVAIVENVQRRDLSSIEEAKSYKNLLDKGYLTQAELAKKMGLSQSAIANKLRLLNLDEEVQKALMNNQISERHARSLLVLSSPEEQRKWLKKIIDERITVRELDKALKKQNSNQNTSSNEADETDIPLVKNIDINAIREEAQEIPKVNEESEIAKKLREIEREKIFNPDIIPVEQARNDSKNNFFNFLENETVNMNMEEPVLNTKALNIELPKKLNQQEPEPINNLTSNQEEVFDPVSLIETLDPAYEVKQEEILGIDLKTAINAIRSAKDSLSAKGFDVSLDETDLSDIYQFIIKIKKN